MPYRRSGDLDRGRRLTVFSRLRALHGSAEAIAVALRLTRRGVSDRLRLPAGVDRGGTLSGFAG
jgi:hypothetical protein